MHGAVAVPPGAWIQRRAGEQKEGGHTVLSRRSVMAGLAAQAALSLVSSRAHGRAPAGPVDFNTLAARLAGDVLTPAAPEYDMARRTFSFNPRTDRHPGAIARCLNADDVARCIEFARRHGLALAVRSGGHDVLAASTCDKGLVIDVSRMSSMRRSESGNSIVVGAGARAGAITQTLAQDGLATPLGLFEGVGISGLALGGGLGAIVASRGATCDNLVRARLVSADGTQLTASKDENAELFWALRGGGGNFGVVTELELATYHLPTAIGGGIVFDGARLADFLRFFPQYMANTPRELVAEARVVATVRPIILVVACFVGDAAVADRVFAPLRAFAPVLADGLRAAPYAAAVASTPAVDAVLREGQDVPPAWNASAGFDWRGGSIRELSDGAIGVMLDSVRNAPRGGWAVNLGHHMHGAVCDVGPDTSPLPRPRNTFTYHFDAWWGDVRQAPAVQAWADAGAAAIAPYAVPSYVNYLSTDAPASIAAAYGQSFTRLRALKRRYDPDNVFRRNRNIPPA